MNLKDQMLKHSVMWLHHSLVQNGKYVEARLLDELGCRTFYPRHIIALVYLEVKT